MREAVCIRHVVGWCPACGEPVLDGGYSDDPELWQHAWPDYVEDSWMTR